MTELLSLMTKEQFEIIKKIAEENGLDFEEMVYYCLYKPMYYCVTTHDKIMRAEQIMRYNFRYFFHMMVACSEENPDLEWYCDAKAESFLYFLEDYGDDYRSCVQNVQKKIQTEIKKHQDNSEPCGNFENGLFSKAPYFSHQFCEYYLYFENDYTFPEYVLHKILTPSIEKPDAADIVLNCVQDIQALLNECFKNHPEEMGDKKLTNEEIEFFNNTIFPRIFYYAELMASLVDEKYIEE